ncbi:MAG: hypothetical protein K6T61_01050 [Bryobacteraceae bacterium]|nr:hypothetical protein [Bryobacteraceae bacterium]
MRIHWQQLWRRDLPVLALCGLLALPSASPLEAQQAGRQGPKIQVVILEGQGALHRVGQRSKTPLVVRVEDENRRPLMGAAVQFTSPDSGPGVVFPNGARVYLLRTDRTGQVEVRGFRANGVQGKFEIEVEASYQGASAKATVVQINTAQTQTARRGLLSSRFLSIAGGVAVGAVLALVLTRSEETAQGPPIAITPGSPSVGGPQ